MAIQEFFYWVASITLILIGIFMVSLLAMMFYLKKQADKITSEIRTATRALRNLTLTRFFLRTLKLFF